MGTGKRTKLNLLLKDWPSGAVYATSWLTRHGVGDDLLAKYRKSGWVETVGKGAVARAGEKIDWTGGLYAIQQQLGMAAHAGGKTALEMQGYAHFLPLGKGAQVWIFGTPGEKLPAWFRNYDWGVMIRYVTANLFGKEVELGLTQKEMGSYSVTISSPERAILETLHLVPHQSSFDGAMHLMEGLTTLRSDLVQTLLELCWSVKVKRLFMFLAEKCNHQWVTKLDLHKIKLGKGKRLIVKGGRLNPKYQITVPV